MFLITAGILLTFQAQKVNTEFKNSKKKTAINAIYYSLEEGFYKTNKYYPEHIKKDTLKTLDPELLTDPDGAVLGEEGAAYRYEPSDCQDGRCQSYSLRSSLDGEADFIKESPKKD